MSHRVFFGVVFVDALAIALGYRMVTDGLAPKLGDGSSVDWWFAYKLPSESHPGCSTKRTCIFGHNAAQQYSQGYGQQYLLSSHKGGKTTKMTLHTDCLGTGADPVAKTFQLIYGGSAANYVIWNDQFYDEPLRSKGAPWGHSKGAMAWDADGNGFIMQVSTPSWPGNGDSSQRRGDQGNTLGCVKDDDVKVGQHFFSLKLNAADTAAVLIALRKASVVTNTSDTKLVKLTNGPSNLATLARSLGSLNSHDDTPFQATLSNGVMLIGKPSHLHVPPWQMVSALLVKGLRTATWWMEPEIYSAVAGNPGCWSEKLGSPQEVQVAISGQWQGVTFGLWGGHGRNGNHAKIAYSLDGSLTIMGDMNQQGAYSPYVTSKEYKKGNRTLIRTRHHGCDSSQNGRGGIFFVVDDSTLHSGVETFMTGETATYYGNLTPGSEEPESTTLEPYSCGGAGVRASTCRTSESKGAGCVYVKSRHAEECGVPGYGCYMASSLAASCSDTLQ